MELENYSNRYMASHRKRYMADIRMHGELQKQTLATLQEQVYGKRQKQIHGKEVAHVGLSSVWKTQNGAWAICNQLHTSVAGEQLLGQRLWCGAPEVLLLGAAHLQPAPALFHEWAAGQQSHCRMLVALLAALPLHLLITRWRRLTKHASYAPWPAIKACIARRLPGGMTMMAWLFGRTGRCWVSCRCW